MANRCLADRTNAWTDTDHTCYTVYTAGKEGFLTILPVYVDHILFPLLREDAFVTEVHHINGQGKDSGVVYSEMQVGQVHILLHCLVTCLFRKLLSILLPIHKIMAFFLYGREKKIVQVQFFHWK